MPPLVQVVIFGASGDLAARKLVPALQGGSAELQAPLQVLGVSRQPLDDERWRQALEERLEGGPAPGWATFREQLHYQAGDVGEPADLGELARRLDTLAAGRPAGRLFYLALKPDLFGPAVAGLAQAGLLAEDPVAWRRVVVEKPFGHDLASARALNRALLEHVREDQLLRIDHYLGKETVQNLLAFRFQNAIFEPLWNRRHVESVEITVAETVGIEGGRGAYYDRAGALRDMLQNHLLQVLALVAMEPPASMQPDDVRDEKVKLIRSLAAPAPEWVVRGRYGPGPGRPRGYLDEPGVAPGSDTETYVAIRAGVHNWRWNGVPFLLRTGKALARRFTQVVLNFRVPPVDLLAGPTDGEACALRPNRLRILIQPHEGFRLDFLVKQPGPGALMRPASLGMDYRDLPGASTTPAYQRLLLDAIRGNATLFIRGDEVEAAWSFADAVRAGWSGPQAPPLPTYPAGSTGPEAAHALWTDSEGTWSLGEP